jgi:hypothetical protein
VATHWPPALASEGRRPGEPGPALGELSRCSGGGDGTLRLTILRLKGVRGAQAAPKHESLGRVEVR